MSTIIAIISFVVIAVSGGIITHQLWIYKRWEVLPVVAIQIPNKKTFKARLYGAGIHIFREKYIGKPRKGQLYFYSNYDNKDVTNGLVYLSSGIMDQNVMICELAD